MNLIQHDTKLAGYGDLIDSYHIQVDTTNSFNKQVGLVFNPWNPFNPSNPFN